MNFLRLLVPPRKPSVSVEDMVQDKVKPQAKATKARAGRGMRPGFEGGQMPLQRRIPKRGFNNIFAKEIVAINVGSLNAFEDGAVVNNDALIEAGIIKKVCDGVKVLGNGEITKKLTVQVAAFSESAKQKIEAAGGKAEVI